MISIVVPAYNEEKFLSDCLASLACQKTRYEFEVIVVDNNSTDKTAKIAKSFREKLNIRVILEKKKGRGSARYAGFKKCRGDIILSTDADTIVPVNWVEMLACNLEKNDIGAVTGPCKIMDLSPLKNSLFNLFQPLAMLIYRLLFGHFWLSGFNFGIQRDTYLASGGFNPEINAVEDIDLSMKVMKIRKIKYVNCPVVFSGRRFKKGFISPFFDYIREYIKLRENKIRMIEMDDPR